MQQWPVWKYIPNGTLAALPSAITNTPITQLLQLNIWKYYGRAGSKTVRDREQRFLLWGGVFHIWAMNFQ